MEAQAGAVRGGGPGGSVPVTLRAQLPQRSGIVQGLKLPARVAARVQSSQIALGGPGMGGVQERERERGRPQRQGAASLEQAVQPVGPRGVGSPGWPLGLTDSVQVLGSPDLALLWGNTTAVGFLKQGSLSLLVCPRGPAPPGSPGLAAWHQLLSDAKPPCPLLSMSHPCDQRGPQAQAGRARDQDTGGGLGRGGRKEGKERRKGWSWRGGERVPGPTQ